MDVVPTEFPAPRRHRRSLIGGLIVQLAGVVAAVGSHRTAAVPAEPGTYFSLKDALWGLTRSLGDENGDVQMVRFLAIVLFVVGLVVLWAGRRGWVAASVATVSGALLTFIGVQWWRVIRQYPVYRSPFGYPMGYGVGDAVYVVGAAGLIAIVGAAIIWASPKSLPVEHHEYPGGAVL